MKRGYVTPKMECEEFAANEYVAACGDEHRVYKFECDSPAGKMYYYKTSDGDINGIYTGTGSATGLGSYNPCGETHEAPTTSDFFDGFIDRNGNKRCDNGEAAIIWLEYTRWGDIRDGHATAQLDMDSWETAKS